MQQLLWFETVLKLVAGLLLVAFPLATVRVLGLPPAGSAFWPRLLGAILVGIAAATFIEGAWDGSRGLGMAGLVLVNLISVTVIALAAMFGSVTTRRGTFVVWGTVVLLFVLALVEIAHA